MASSDVKTASPIAVPSPSCRRLIPRSTTAILSVGGTMRRAPLSKLDEADPHALRHVLEEGAGGVLRGGQAGRGHVLGLHRQRGVHGEHDDAPLVGGLLRHRGLGQRERQRDEPEQQPDGREVPAPAGPLGGHGVEQVHGREAHDVAPPAQLRHDVGGQQQDRQEQEPEPGGGEEGQGEHQRRLPGARVAPTRWRRRAPTKRTRSTTQSRSVRRTRWWAPAAAIRWATSVRREAAASA